MANWIKISIFCLAVFALAAMGNHEAIWESAIAGAGIAWALITTLQRHRRELVHQRSVHDAKVIEAAEILAHAFALTGKPCIDETRALSRAVFLGDAPMKELAK